MNSKDISFDENYCMYDVYIDEQKDPVAIELSDSLEAVDEVLTESYKEKIADFVNKSAKWFNSAEKKIFDDVKDVDGLKLMTIYVLSEQESLNEVFGLLFNLNKDREHGRGMKIEGKNLEIIEYGDAHVAFS